MACYQPLLAVDYSLDPDTGQVRWLVNGKHQLKIYPRPKYLKMQENGTFAAFRKEFGKRLMLLPCNKCVGCAKDYARMWQARIMCEFEYHEKACFLTLTYAHDREPNKVDFRRFIKAVRNKFGQGIKFFGCGEKGDLNARFHLHIILFGVDFSEDRKVFNKRGLNLTYVSDTLSHLWEHKGHCMIGDLDLESAGYVSRYCDKKKIKGLSDGEFVLMSRGLGKQYLLDHKDDILDSDFVYFKGNKFKLPRYFLKLMDNLDFNYQVYADEYKQRKREVASSFRYGSNRSVHYEEEGMKMDEHSELIKHEQKGGFRDVGIY